MDDNYALKSAIFARQEQILKGIAKQDSIMKVMPGGRAARDAAGKKETLLLEQAKLASDPSTWSEDKKKEVIEILKKENLLPKQGGRRKSRTHKRTLRKHKRTLRKHKRTLRKHKRRTHRR